MLGARTGTAAPTPAAPTTTTTTIASFTTPPCVVWSDDVAPVVVPGARYVYVRPGQDYQITRARCMIASAIEPSGQQPCMAPTFDQCVVGESRDRRD